MNRKTLTPTTLCISIAAHALVVAALCVFVKRIVAPEPERVTFAEIEVVAGRTDAEAETSAESEPETEKTDAAAERTPPEAESAADIDPEPEPEPETETADVETEETDAPEEDAENGTEDENPEHGDDAPEPAASSLPVQKSSIDIAYPKRARRRNEEGDVTVELGIGADGAVSDARILKSSGSSDLDSAALAALKSAAYEPATRDGKPVPGTLVETVKFRLK